jgi:hypothetical protein
MLGGWGTAAKQTCQTVLHPAMQTFAESLAVFFVVEAIACLVIGIVVAVVSSGSWRAEQRSDSLSVIAISLFGLFFALAGAALTFFGLGFSSWCY